jgi:hypothetical protein
MSISRTGQLAEKWRKIEAYSAAVGAGYKVGYTQGVISMRKWKMLVLMYGARLIARQHFGRWYHGFSPPNCSMNAWAVTVSEKHHRK